MNIRNPLPFVELLIDFLDYITILSKKTLRVLLKNIFSFYLFISFSELVM